MTRDGEFNIDANGYLITNNGMRVKIHRHGALHLGQHVGDLQINAAAAIAALGDTTTPAPSPDSWSIDASGQITATLSDNVTGVIGQMVLQNFTNFRG